MTSFTDKFVKTYALFQWPRIESMRFNSVKFQEKLFDRILYKSASCSYLKEHGIKRKSKRSDFLNQVPLTTYEDLEPYIQRMIAGERDLLCSGQVKWYAKSSGTEGAKSKFIPVTRRFMRNCYTRTNWDVVSLLYNHNPDIGIFKGKSLLMGGSLSPFDVNPKSTNGDVSALIIEHMPSFAKAFYTPSREIALMADWDEKLELMTTICSEEKVVCFAGVPTWLLVLFRRIMSYKDAGDMHEVWPDAKVFIHGGVGFDPYRDEFKKMFPKEDFLFLEAYTASEGYFGIQDRMHEEGMLLLTDNGTYYEFLPLSEIDSTSPRSLQLEEIEIDTDYAIVITTSCGLWRYKIGDVVRFQEINPYRFKVVGRTKQFINTFGEELMVHNTDKAIAETCDLLSCTVSNYTAAPIFFNTKDEQPGHQWLVEFDKRPDSLKNFAEVLDMSLQKLNSDYEAKRTGDLAIQIPKVVALEKGSFDRWLRANSRWGAQVKIPRLSNDRIIIEEILSYTNG